MTTDDIFNVCIDAPTVALVDAWARRSAFQPSRRQAVRALLRRALREMQKQDAPPLTAGQNHAADALPGHQARNRSLPVNSRKCLPVARPIIVMPTWRAIW